MSTSKRIDGWESQHDDQGVIHSYYRGGREVGFVLERWGYDCSVYAVGEQTVPLHHGRLKLDEAKALLEEWDDTADPPSNP